MIEITLSKEETETEERFEEITRKLLVSGWKKFGNNGSAVFFKDFKLEEAIMELESLDIFEIEPEEWHEELLKD